jgi:hypothetical protein
MVTPFFNFDNYICLCFRNSVLHVRETDDGIAIVVGPLFVKGPLGWLSKAFVFPNVDGLAVTQTLDRVFWLESINELVDSHLI